MKKWILVVTALAIPLLAYACGPMATPTPTPNIQATVEAIAAMIATETAIAQAQATVAAEETAIVATQTTMAVSPTPTFTPPSPTPTSTPPTPTPTSTDTPVPTSTPTQTPTPPPLSCPDAAYVTDVTVPDNTRFDQGEAFVKIWRVRNNGACPWPEGTTLVFVSGDALDAPASVEVGALDVGQTKEISVNMTAPGAGGPYKGTWQLADSGGQPFGTILTVVIQAYTLEPSSHPIYVGARLAPGYDMGVNTSGGRTDWVTDMNGYMRMAYPSGQSWGAVFITVGEPTSRQRPGQDLSNYHVLSLELRGEVGGEKVWIGIKDNTDYDDGTETKFPVYRLTTEWQTFMFPLPEFWTADLARLYVVIEFVFDPFCPAETVYFRNIQYRRSLLFPDIQRRQDLLKAAKKALRLMNGMGWEVDKGWVLAPEFIALYEEVQSLPELDYLEMSPGYEATYDQYRWAVDNVLDTSRDLYLNCKDLMVSEEEERKLPRMQWGLSRMGVSDSVKVLHQIIELLSDYSR
jgi:hypothetical protein